MLSVVKKASGGWRASRGVTASCVSAGLYALRSCVCAGSAKAKPAAGAARPRPSGGRVSDGGYVAPPPPPTYGLPHRKAPHEGGLGSARSAEKGVGGRGTRMRCRVAVSGEGNTWGRSAGHIRGTDSSMSSCCPTWGPGQQSMCCGMRQRAPTHLCSRRRLAATHRPCQPFCSCLAPLPKSLSSLNLTTPFLPSALLKPKPPKFCADPHGLVGKRVNIIQEDDSTVEGMIVDWNPSDQTHVVLVGMGTADEACEPLPLVEYPDAYQVCLCVCVCACVYLGGGGAALCARYLHPAGCLLFWECRVWSEGWIRGISKARLSAAQ